MIDVTIDITSDSSAARSVARRRGIGRRLGHLHTRLLWPTEQSSSWSPEVRRLLQRNKTHWTHSRKQCQVARFASGQKMLDSNGCSGHSDKATVTAIPRSIVSSRRSEQRGTRRGSLNVRSREVQQKKSKRVSGTVHERDNAMHSG